MWDVRTQDLLLDARDRPLINRIPPSGGNDRHSLAFSRDNHHLFAGCAVGNAYKLNIQSGEQKSVFMSSEEVNSLAIAPRKNLIAVGKTTVIDVVDSDTCRPCLVDGHGAAQWGDKVDHIIFCSSGHHILARERSSSSIKWHDLSRAKPDRVFKHPSAVIDFAVSHDDRWIMSATNCEPGTAPSLHVWNLATAQEVRTVEQEPLELTNANAGNGSERGALSHTWVMRSLDEAIQLTHSSLLLRRLTTLPL